MKIVALAGGVGGAKLAHGLAQILPPEDLTVIVNTGDDFEHYGLYISPDLDTVCYTLARLANPETGWGRVDETWGAIENAKRLGGPGWFNLGDQDLGTHLERTRRMKAGQTLSQITRDFCEAWGVGPTVLPMSDQPVRTIVETDEGDLAFQEYFVHRRCEPKVRGFCFEGVEIAEAAPGALEALESADAVVICPSNPWVSIDPILKVIQLRSMVNRPSSIVAVSPIIGGQAVKGPVAKMYAELGIQPSALAVAEHYRGLLSGFVLDRVDEGLANQIESPTLTTDTLMNHLTKRAQLAEAVLNFIRRTHI
jgi:LPPG:FO 2-phospho-L-lactate transferase